MRFCSAVLGSLSIFNDPSQGLISISFLRYPFRHLYNFIWGEMGVAFSYNHFTNTLDKSGTGDGSGSVTLLSDSRTSLTGTIFNITLQDWVAQSQRMESISLGGTVNNIIHGGSDLKINVITPDLGATTNKQQVDIVGYYL